MSKLLINDSTLFAIGDAIRYKNGSQEKYKPSEMPNAILDISANSTGRMSIMKPLGAYAFYENSWNHMMPYITFEGPEGYASPYHLFENCDELEEPMSRVVLYDDGSHRDGSIYLWMFSNCKKLKRLPKFDTLDGNPLPIELSYAFYNCQTLTEIDLNSFSIPPVPLSTIGFDCAFENCINLKGSLDFQNYFSTTNQSWPPALDYYRMFFNCHSLKKILNLSAQRVNWTYDTTFGRCYRLSNLTFGNNDTLESGYYDVIDLTNYTGYVALDEKDPVFTGDTSKEITNETTYNLLKNDADAWTADIRYSFYNKASAVETINSLPAYEKGYTATIKFKGQSGELTDSGAINTMTEEEIAVATNKGWTVSFT